MNSHDTNRHAEPLSPEERALGERLARLAPHGEPSPALDARILAAAHAAATPSAQTRRPSRRWPMALGIAASLTLAVGIAWQLRPAQEAAIYDEAASATAVQAEAAAAPQEPAAEAVAADQVRAGEAQPALDASAMQAPPSRSRRESDKALPAPRRAPQAERAQAPAPAPPAPAEPEVVFDDPPAVDAAIPAPAAPPAAATVRAPAPAAKAISAEPRPQGAERNRTGTAATSAAGTAAGTTTQSREDAFAEDVPPATADSPEVREAWLQRIRELAQSGQAGDARASLEEFVHRYPDHPLPDDLRALLE